MQTQLRVGGKKRQKLERQKCCENKGLKYITTS